MAIFDVTAIAVDPQTGQVLAGPNVETVDTVNNVIFEGCTSPWQVEDKYHGFWNRLNHSWEMALPAGHQKVCVLSVVEA